MYNRTILLVEDAEDDVELTRRAFAKHGITSEIVVARDGAEALDYLFGDGPRVPADPPPGPAVVLLDLNLPRIDGLEVLRRIRADARTRRLPVVVLTSSNDAEDIARSYDLGANSFVRKPVDFLEFVAAARQLSSYWLVLNESSPMPHSGGNR